jgi:SAM-dependent methyltransferase
MIKCPVCESELRLVFKLSSDIYYCRSCSLYVAPEVRFNETFHSAINQDEAYSALKDLRMSNFRQIISVLKKELPQNAKGLDVGCSYGWFLETCKNNDISCVGIEPEKALAEYARANGHTVMSGFFPEDLDRNITQLEFIIFNDVFEHIPDIHKTLESCYQLLTPGGILIINIPLSTGFFYKTAKLLYRFGLKKPLERMWQLDFHSPHFHYFNKTNLRKLVGSKGFNLHHFHNLDTITRDSITSRVNMNSKKNFGSRMTVVLLKIIQPLLGKMPGDIGCFYFKK